MLSNTILRLVAQQMDKANKMTPNQLSLFAMILTSEEMRSVIDLQSSQLDVLEESLIKNLELFNSSELAMVCNTA